MKTSAIFLIMLLFAGCYSADAAKEDITKVVFPKQMPGSGFEIEIRYTFLGNSGPSTPSLVPKKYSGTYWIYVPKSQGRWPTESIVISSTKGFLSPPWALSGLKGVVELTPNAMTIDVQQPRVPDGVHPEGYEAFFLNGSYRVEWK